MQIEDLTSLYNMYSDKFEQLKEIFNVSSIETKIQAIDKRIIDDPSFYNKQESRQILKDQMRLKKLLEEWEELEDEEDDDVWGDDEEEEY